MHGRSRRCEHQHHHRHVHWRASRKRTLQRRIFLWLGATIVFTAVVIGALFRLLSPASRLEQDREGFARFVSGRFEAVWDEPGAPAAFVRDMHADLHLDAALYDARGHLVARAGPACAEPWGDLALVRRDGRRMGHLEVCGQPYDWGRWRFGLVLLVAIAILWGASGILARRLFRPLRDLEHMARRIAEGDLSARAHLSPQRHGEMGVLGQTMDEMATRIEKQLADQRELLAAVSHELRTPLGHLRVLLEMERDKPSASRVDEIEREVLEVDALVAQLLASSRVDFGRLDLKSVDAVELAARALERAELGVDRLEVEGDAGLIEADPTLMARALANLLRNGQQHGGGVTRLVLTFTPRELIVAVEDAGPGVSVEEREKVFDAFYRGEHRAGGSLGLGLSLVSRIAAAHGGRAWIEGLEPEGARVCFSISAVAADAAPSDDRAPAS